MIHITGEGRRKASFTPSKRDPLALHEEPVLKSARETAGHIPASILKQVPLRAIIST